MPLLRPFALLVALVLPAGIAAATERSVMLGNFDRVRVQGALQVTIGTTRVAGATITGDADLIEAVETQLDGTTLTLRRRIRPWSEQAQRAHAPLTVTLGADALIGASIVGPGSISVARMKGAKVEVSATGNGSIHVAAVDAAVANATVIGAGTIELAGHAGAARLVNNGSGTIDAGALEAGDLAVRVDGPGDVKGRARFTATIVDTGLGQVSVAGQPKCTVTAPAGGPVTCG